MLVPDLALDEGVNVLELAAVGARGVLLGGHREGSTTFLPAGKWSL